MIFHFLRSEYIVKNYSFKICIVILLPILSVRNATSSTNTSVAADISHVYKSAQWRRTESKTTQHFFKMMLLFQTILPSQIEQR